MVEACSRYAGECILDSAKRSGSSIRRRAVGEFGVKVFSRIARSLVLVRELSSVNFLSFRFVAYHYGKQSHTETSNSGLRNGQLNREIFGRVNLLSQVEYIRYLLLRIFQRFVDFYVTPYHIPLLYGVNQLSCANTTSICSLFNICTSTAPAFWRSRQ